MLLRSLQVDGLRCLRSVALTPAPGFNVMLGANGSGKTSLLEAIHILTHGRSFRPGGHAALKHRDSPEYAVFGEIELAGQRVHRIGMAHGDGGWRMRVDGQRVATLGDAIARAASVCFEPGSHALVSGGSAGRRRFLDWGVFHVEQAFLPQWQRYQRALRQRNALLRQGAGEAQLLPWETQMAQTGEPLDAWRRAYVATLQPRLRHEVQQLVPSLGEVELRFSGGWAAGQPLAEALASSRQRDRHRGHTHLGPHRANWRMRFDAVDRHEHLSRGQQKLAALACVLAQAACFAAHRGEWPVVCLDDLASELDRGHQHRLVQRLLDTGAQVWVTGTERPEALADHAVRLFHVEQGRFTQTTPGD